MCLISKNSKMEKAANDIVCYKVLYQGIMTKDYYTPYLFCYVPNNIINGDKCFFAEGRRKIYRHLNKYRIEGGVIHTYKSMEEAETKRRPCGNFNRLIFKCIIPKGTYYFEGETDYASKKIKFVKLIF